MIFEGKTIEDKTNKFVDNLFKIDAVYLYPHQDVNEDQDKQQYFSMITYIYCLLQFVLTYITLICNQGDGVVKTLDHLKVFFNNPHINPENNPESIYKSEGNPKDKTEDKYNEVIGLGNSADVSKIRTMIGSINFFEPEYQQNIKDKLATLAGKTIDPKFRLELDKLNVWTNEDETHKPIEAKDYKDLYKDNNNIRKYDDNYDPDIGSRYLMYKTLSDLRRMETGKPDEEAKPSKFIMFANILIKDTTERQEIIMEAAKNTLKFAEGVSDKMEPTEDRDKINNNWNNLDNEKTFVATTSGGGGSRNKRKLKRKLKRKRSKKNKANRTKINKKYNTNLNLRSSLKRKNKNKNRNKRKTKRKR